MCARIEAVIPSMRAQHSGRIVNVVGMASKLPTPGYVLGCLNAALLHITKTFADALASDGISVVAVNPGATATSRIRTALETWAKAAGQRVDEYTVEYERSIPLGRLGTPAEGRVRCRVHLFRPGELRHWFLRERGWRGHPRSHLAWPRH